MDSYLKSSSVRRTLLIWTLLLCIGQTFAADRARIYGAVLPVSRSVQVETTATAFATLVNATPTTATGCGLALGTDIDADFAYRATDSLTNGVISPAETVVDIPAGGAASWVFGITPRSELPPTDVVITMSCDTGAAPVYPGVNTLLLSATAEPRPDIIGLAATLANDGVAHVPGFVGTGVFSVATSNVGSAGVVTAVPELLGEDQGATVRICQTDAAGGCIEPPAAFVQFVADAGGSNSFGVFIEAGGTPVAFDPANTRVRVGFRDGAGVERGATSVAYETQTVLGSYGGTLFYAGTTVGLQPDDAWAPVEVVPIDRAGPPAPLPPGFDVVERVRGVSVSDETRLNAPLEMIFDYDQGRVGSDAPMVLRYDEGRSRYLPVTVLGIDASADRIRVEARDFSDFVTTAVPTSPLPSDFAVPRFDINRDVWNLANFGAYFAPGGNSIGMAAYAAWFASQRPGESLIDKFSTEGGAPNSPAHTTATRAQLAQSQYWRDWQSRSLDQLPARYVYEQIRLGLALTNEPQLLFLGIGGQTERAAVVYGWNSVGFLIYDLDKQPGSERGGLVSYSGFHGAFEPYGAYDSVGLVMATSLGRSADFEQLTQSAEAGFPSSGGIFVETPFQGQTFDAREAPLAGGLTGDLTGGGKVVSYFNGEKSLIGNDVTTFESVLAIKSGENTLILVAGAGADGSMWFPDSPVLIRTFYNSKPAATLRATLTWNKQGDVDIYVIEPAGEAAWYANLVTSNGLELDFDNVVAYGPENITLSLGEGDTVLPGDYRVRVHYYSGQGPVSGQVQVVTYEGELQQHARTYNWTIPVSGNPASAGPAGSGPEWVDITTIDLLNNVIR